MPMMSNNTELHNLPWIKSSVSWSDEILPH